MRHAHHETARRRPRLVGVAAVIAAASAATISVVVLPAHAASTLPLTVAHTYQANGRVAAILSVGNTVYLAGSFTSLRPYGDAAGKGEVARKYLAAVDRTTGALLPWNPSANKEAYALAASPDGSTIYAGGLFSQVGGKARLKVAAMSASSGALTTFAPTIDNKVLALAVTSSRVYLGGTFTTVNGVARSGLASVTLAGTLDTAWHPAPNDAVRALLLSSSGSTLYAGGDFLSVNGDTKQKHFASLSATSGAVLAWNYHPGYPVYALAANASTIFIGGNGSGGHVGAYALSNGSRLWEQQTDGGVQAVSVIGSVLYVGGHFDNFCSPTGAKGAATTGFECPQAVITRHKLLGLATSNGALDPWAPGANSPLGVYAFGNGGGALQVGGDFTKLGKPDGLGQATWAQQSYGQFG